METGLKKPGMIHLGDAVFRATLLPASRYRESILSADSSRGGLYSTGVASGQEDIKTKTARYRGLKNARIPLILAISSDWPLIDWETMFSALYGDEQITLKFNVEDLVAVEGGTLTFGGRLTPNRTGEVRYRGLSAAWLLRWQLHNDDMFAEVVHFPNPWAANPIRIGGQDIARVTFRRIGADRVTFLRPRRRRLLKIS